jgi:hypothetical protein
LQNPVAKVRFGIGYGGYYEEDEILSTEIAQIWCGTLEQSWTLIFARDQLLFSVRLAWRPALELPRLTAPAGSSKLPGAAIVLRCRPRQ